MQQGGIRRTVGEQTTFCMKLAYRLHHNDGHLEPLGEMISIDDD